MPIFPPKMLVCPGVQKIALSPTLEVRLVDTHTHNVHRIDLGAM